MLSINEAHSNFAVRYNKYPPYLHRPGTGLNQFLTCLHSDSQVGDACSFIPLTLKFKRVTKFHFQRLPLLIIDPSSSHIQHRERIPCLSC